MATRARCVKSGNRRFPYPKSTNCLQWLPWVEDELVCPLQLNFYREAKQPALQMYEQHIDLTPSADKDKCCLFIFLRSQFSELINGHYQKQLFSSESNLTKGVHQSDSRPGTLVCQGHCGDSRLHLVVFTKFPAHHAPLAWSCTAWLAHTNVRKQGQNKPHQDIAIITSNRHTKILGWCKLWTEMFLRRERRTRSTQYGSWDGRVTPQYLFRLWLGQMRPAEGP